MKLRSLLGVLNPEIVVHLFDDYKLELVVKVKDIQNELKERNVKTLHRSYTDSLYDFSILLKV